MNCHWIMKTSWKNAVHAGHREHRKSAEHIWQISSKIRHFFIFLKMAPLGAG